MKVIAVGAGGMGREAVMLAAELPGISQLVIADRDRRAADSVADGVRAIAARRPPSSLSVASAGVDVTDRAALTSLLRDADVVVNTVGPFYRYARSVLETAIETGTHYLDICDDWEPTVELLDLDDRARQRGVIAVVGMGASPGLSNMLAVVAARHLMTVRRLFTGWPVDAGGAIDEDLDVLTPDGEPIAAAVHWMHQLAGSVRVLTHGRPGDRPALDPVTLHYPGRAGGTAYVIGHPEPATLPRSLGVTEECATLMLLTPATTAFLAGLKDDLDAGRLDEVRAARELGRQSISRLTRSGMRARRYAGPGGLPGFFAYADGERDGSPTVAGATINLPGLTMAKATATPLVIGLGELLAGNVLAGPGVHPPEKAFDADRVLGQLQARWADEADEPLLSVTVSPATAPATAGPRLP